MADLQVQRVTVPYDGLDTDSAPETIAETQGPVVQNVLVDRPGKLPMRGPINEASGNLSLAANVKVIGAWTFNDKLLLGTRAASATATRDHWVAPYRKAAASATLTAFATPTKFVDLIAKTVTDVIVTADNAPGHRGSRLGAHVYGVGQDAVAAAVLENGGYKKLVNLLRWDGTATAPTAYANAPKGAQDVKAYYQRILVLGGRNPDGTGQIQQNTLWWSDPISGVTALPDTLAAWQDDVSGLTNQLVIDSDDANDFGVGMAKIGGALAIFKRRSIHLLLGVAPSSWAVKTFTIEQGCLDPRSICEYEDGCFFMSDQGLMFFDGSQIVNTTERLRSSLLTEALRAVGDAGVDGGRAIVGKLPNGYIGCSIGVSDSQAASTTTWAGMYHTGRRAWVTLQSDALSGGPTWLGRSSTKVWLLDDTKVVQANKLTAPETEIAQARGIDTTDGLFVWASDAAFNGAGNTLRSAGVDAFPTSNQYPIKSLFRTRLIRLATPILRSQLHRFLIDYNFEVNGAADQSANPTSPTGWYVQLISGSSDALTPEYQLPSQGDNTVHTYRRRHTRDVFTEVNDFYLVVQWKGTPLPLTRAEVLGAVVEYQATKLRATQ